MQSQISKFQELLRRGRESNDHDYKKQLDLSSKPKKYEFLKDILAFSNFGGGYLLFGIDEMSSLEIIDQKTRYDPADISNIIDEHLGYTIDFDLSYFQYEDKLVGLMEISPSKKLLTSPKTFKNEKSEIIISKDDILTRRGTKSIKASRDDIETIMNRIRPLETTSDQIESTSDQNLDKEKIFKDHTDYLNNLYNVIENKFEFKASQFAINIRGFIWYSSLSKKQFSQHTGISVKRLNIISSGEELPTIDELYRIAKEHEVGIEFFFKPKFHGDDPLWKRDIFRFALISLLDSKYKIRMVQDLDRVLGMVVYDTAKNIIEFLDFLERKGASAYDTKLQPILTKWDEVASNEIKVKFIQELRVQYYKVIEIGQVKKKQGLTKTERLFESIHFLGTPRLFIEVIKSIHLNGNELPKIEFHFWDEIAKLEIRGRNYNEKDFKMEFGEVKFSIN